MVSRSRTKQIAVVLARGSERFKIKGYNTISKLPAKLTEIDYRPWERD
jgi:hypothetical protein